MGQRRRQTSQSLVDPLDVLPRPLMFAVAIQPLLPGKLLAWAQRPLLHFQQPLHRLFGDLGREIRGMIHSAK
ncbi:hypothetical protein D3C73_1378580 [compost metagenome]